MRMRLLCWLLLGLVILLPGHRVLADDGTTRDRVVLGENFTLKRGEAIDGNLVVIGGETALEAGALVSGDVVVIGGSLRMDGRIGGSAIVLGGSVALGENSSVTNDLVALGGGFQRSDSSTIGGDIITNLSIATDELPRGATAPTPPLPPEAPTDLDFGPMGTLAAVLLQAIGLGAVAMLLTAFLHPQLDRVAQAARLQPLAAGSFGLLTAFAAPLAIAVMAITLILIPFALAAAILLALAWLFGVVALGHLVGERLLEALHRRWEPVLTAGFGALVLGIVLAALNQIPCVGWLGVLLIGLVGLGAATMTLFGTRSGLGSLNAPVATAQAETLPPAT